MSEVTEGSRPPRGDRPSTAVLKLTAEVLGVAARRPGPQVVLAGDGLAVVSVVDSFAERLIDLHWQAIECVLSGEPHLLELFVGIELDDHELAHEIGQVTRVAAPVHTGLSGGAGCL